MAEAPKTDPFTFPQFPGADSAATMLIGVNRALVTSGERMAAVQRDAAGELTTELRKLGAINELSALPQGQAEYANALGRLAMSVAGEMFDIQRDLQKELSEVMSAAFTVRPTTQQAA